MKLMIIDDEYVVRQGIRKMIDWKSLGIDTLIDAETVEEAIQKGRSWQPDIILCDIRLPGGSGFDIITALAQANNDAEFIIISGYDDKEYMFSAIRSNIVDYILKPAAPEHVQRAVRKAVQKILCRRKERALEMKNSTLIMENLDLLQGYYIENLLLGSEDTYLKTEAYQIRLEGPFFRLLLARYTAENFYNASQQLSMLFFSCRPIIVSLPHEQEVMVALLNTDESGAEALMNPAVEMQLADCFSGPIAVSKVCDSPNAFNGERKGLYQVLNRQLWLEKGRFYAAATEFPELHAGQLDALKKEVFSSLKEEKSVAKILSDFEGYFSYFQACMPEDFIFEQECDRFLHFTAYLLSVSYKEEGKLTPKNVPKLFSTLIQNCGKPQNRYRSGMVGKALRYLEENFDTDISLEQTALHLHLSSPYLSKLIKEKTGQTFQEWLHQMRIEKARRLLVETEETTYRIAEKCGYNSYKLFAEHFKRETGMTATEYREKSGEV